MEAGSAAINRRVDGFSGSFLRNGLHLPLALIFALGCLVGAALPALGVPILSIRVQPAGANANVPFTVQPVIAITGEVPFSSQVVGATLTDVNLAAVPVSVAILSTNV